ncbi:MAG: magnesium transporter [Deltaproteobacteria bacterium]|nr:magnesium transporter [Deltaproteobacteria bacterium]
MADRSFTAAELHEAWPALSMEERAEGFELLQREEAERFFTQLSAHDQAQMVLLLPPGERRIWLRLLPPDEAVDLIQEAPLEERENLLQLFDDTTRAEVRGLLVYAEDDAGGLMNPRYARLRPDMSVDEAISYLRRDARTRGESAYYAYVVDAENRLRGVVSFRDLFVSSGEKRIETVMRKDVVTASEDMDQEALSQLFARHNLIMIPVVDSERRIKGVVTLDDIIDVVQEEATEDIQKIGGTAALEAPYLEVPLLQMIGKRAGWLTVLFIGEMLTATAMGHFEAEIARAVVLALFVPLIISSGGNSGSQASTLVIRAMALGEVRLRDWWLVVRRELATGFVLGSILAGIGLIRILVWQSAFQIYGEHYVLVGVTVAVSLLGVVLWGTLAGSTLPLVLRMIGLDPASASAPFVATLVDVTGILIYFSVANVMLRGTLL